MQSQIKTDAAYLERMIEMQLNRIDLGFGEKGHPANGQASCYLHKSPSPVDEGGAKHDSLIF